jgi:hypothetical protein
VIFCRKEQVNFLKLVNDLMFVMTEEILKLSGKAADAFLEYDRRELTSDEKISLKKARQYYKEHCDF